MRKKNRTTETGSGSPTTETPRKTRTPAPKTERMLQLERELEGEKLATKELARLADGSKLSKWLGNLTQTGKGRVAAIMNPAPAPEGERPTDAAFSQPQPLWAVGAGVIK